MTHYITSLKTHTRLLLDASVGGTLRSKNEDEVNELIEKMWQKWVDSNSET